VPSTLQEDSVAPGTGGDNVTPWRDLAGVAAVS
jgi:hypothetical protein